MPRRPPPSISSGARPLPALAADLRAHLAQRIDHALHRPLAQRSSRRPIRCERAAPPRARTKAASSCRNCRNRSASPGARSPSQPLPSTQSASPSRKISTPIWRKARTVRELSSPPERLKIRLRPCGDAAEDHRAMRDRFVARHGDIALQRLVDRFDAFHDPALRDLRARIS